MRPWTRARRQRQRRRRVLTLPTYLMNDKENYQCAVVVVWKLSICSHHRCPPDDKRKHQTKKQSHWNGLCVEVQWAWPGHQLTEHTHGNWSNIVLQRLTELNTTWWTVGEGSEQGPVVWPSVQSSRGEDRLQLASALTHSQQLQTQPREEKWAGERERERESQTRPWTSLCHKRTFSDWYWVGKGDIVLTPRHYFQTEWDQERDEDREQQRDWEKHAIVN